VGLAALAVFAVAAVAYYVTPKYTRVGFQPVQPINFSHELHVGHLGLVCTHCHTHVTDSSHANVPAAQVCMNCHGGQWGNIKPFSAALAPLREAWSADRPIAWIRLHQLPDYVYFDHAVHVRRGVGCVSCHGQINEMPVVRHQEPLSMAWCLDCHRAPQHHLRPADRVMDLTWSPDEDPFFRADSRDRFIRNLMEDVGIHPPQDCSGCHR